VQPFVVPGVRSICEEVGDYMNPGHWHTGAENIAIYGLSAIVVFNVWRVVAAHVAKQDGLIGQIGKSAGALVSFPAQ
jgi:hypothetical protein